MESQERETPSTCGINTGQQHPGAQTVEGFLREQAALVRSRLPALGPVIMLYLQSAHRRCQFVGDLEWLLLPPLTGGQCKLYLKGDDPVSFISWAFLDERCEHHLLSSGGRLRPEDWCSGDNLWVIDIVAPFGGVATVLNDIRSMFDNRPIRMLVPDPDTGGVAVRLLEPFRKTDQHDDSPEPVVGI